MFLTVSSMWSLCKQLKAFAKSSLTKIWSSSMLSRKRRAACMAASQPPDTPTPTCTGLKNQQVWPKHRRKHIWQPVGNDLSEHRFLTAAEMLPSSSFAETAASFEVTASHLALLEAVRTLSSSSTELELVLLMITHARFLFFLPS